MLPYSEYATSSCNLPPFHEGGHVRILSVLLFVYTLFYRIARRLFRRVPGKFAFYSKFLPPLWSGQAVVIARLLRGLPEDSYCLIRCMAPGMEGDYQKNKSGEAYVFRQETSWARAVQPTTSGVFSFFLSAVIRSFRIACAARKARADIIIGCSGDIIDPIAAMLASRLTGSRFFMYFFDDYTLQWWQDKNLVALAHAFERRLCFVAQQIFVPSEQMGDLISLRYHRTSVLVRNPAPEQKPDEQLEPVAWPLQPGKLVLLFTGAVYHLNIDALAAVARGAEYFSNTCGVDAELHIYTAQDHATLRGQGLDHPRIHLFGHVPPSEVADRQRQAEILILPFSPFPEAEIFVNSSATAKLADYLATGRPVMALCPDQSFLALFLKFRDCGCSVSVCSPEAIGEKIKFIYDDSCLRQRWRDNALRVSATEFSIDKAQKALLGAFEVLGDTCSVKQRPSVLHVSGFDVFGAQANGYLLHRYCLSRGVSSQMAVAKKGGADPEVCLLSGPISSRLNALFARIEAKWLRSYSFLPVLACKLPFMRCYRQADVVHYHLAHVIPFFSLYLLRLLSGKKKVVLSVHDMFWMTGHCTYALSCGQWRRGCVDCLFPNRCFGLGDREASAAVWRKKYAIIHDINPHLIGGSRLLQEEIRQSPILRDCPVTNIIYGTDTNVFYNRGKQFCRQKYGISQDAFVVFFRAARRPEDIKGFEYAVQALNLLRPDRQVACITTETIGCVESLKDRYEVHEFGWLTSQDILAEILSAADVLLMPSVGEGFGLLATESMACGTPVIVFEGTALPETVGAPYAGIAVPRSASALARAVKRLMDSPEELAVLAEVAAAYVRDHYSFERYAESHIELYKRLVRE